MKLVECFLNKSTPEVGRNRGAWWKVERTAMIPVEFRWKPIGKRWSEVSSFEPLYVGKRKDLGGVVGATVDSRLAEEARTAEGKRL